MNNHTSYSQHPLSLPYLLLPPVVGRSASCQSGFVVAAPDCRAYIASAMAGFTSTYFLQQQQQHMLCATGHLRESSGANMRLFADGCDLI
jgi:hypothetical protein